MGERRAFGTWSGAAVLVFSSCVVAAGAYAAPRPWASKVPPQAVHAANPLPPGPATVNAGKEVYENTCLPCHGPGAQGDGPAAQFIKPKPKPLVFPTKLSLPDGVMFWVITNGIENTGMASFSDQLSETERWQAISYLHTLVASEQGAAPAVANGGTPAATPNPSPAANPNAAPGASATPGDAMATAGPNGAGATDSAAAAPSTPASDDESVAENGTGAAPAATPEPSPTAAVKSGAGASASHGKSHRGSSMRTR